MFCIYVKISLIFYIKFFSTMNVSFHKLLRKKIISDQSMVSTLKFSQWSELLVISMDSSLLPEMRLLTKILRVHLFLPYTLELKVEADFELSSLKKTNSLRNPF